MARPPPYLCGVSNADDDGLGVRGSLCGEIEEAVLVALEHRLARDGIHLPEPRTKPAKPDRLELALRAPAESCRTLQPAV